MTPWTINIVAHLHKIPSSLIRTRGAMDGGTKKHGALKTLSLEDSLTAV